MNVLLEEKLQNLEMAADFECWYLVKQPTAFDSLCYLVSFLEEYQKSGSRENIADFIVDNINTLKLVKPDIEISANYRALRVAAFFGLITMKTSSYADAHITDTYHEIAERCQGAFEKTELYADIIERQIEKIYLSSPIDEAYNGVRKEYRLYPVMLLYKILLELGCATGSYAISMTEYRYLLATTKKYEDFLDTLLLIMLLRRESDANTAFDTYRMKFDNRLIQALKQLDTLVIGKDAIALKEERIPEIAQKIHVFEKNPNAFVTGDYLAFLGSTKTLFDLPAKAPENPMVEETADAAEDTEQKRHTFYTGYQSSLPRNYIFFGAPGTGKSYRLNQEKEKLLSVGGDYERVTFHPNYSYANFVGTYKPVSVAEQEGKESITYRYVPGPFMRMLVKALKNSRTNHSMPYLLLIEEINRANVAAVFGEVFQLLDRNEKNFSEYGIQASEDMKKYLAEELGGVPEDYSEIRLPDNLFLWATMNSADQGVYPMDTAFKRRWEFAYIGVDQEETAADYKIPLGMGEQRYYVRWNALRKGINQILSEECNVNEDKLLGPFFLSKQVLEGATGDAAGEDGFIQAFESKVIMYLFEDAVKMSPAKIFRGYQKTQGKIRFSELCKAFEEEGEGIFGLTLEREE